MMKDLLKTNCFDTQETMIIVGSCLDRMQPEAYKELEQLSSNIYDVCLEKEHLNRNNDINNNKQNNLSQNYAYFEEKIFIIDGFELNINIWDTPGEENHKEANKHFIKDCLITYLCFHFKSPTSFENIKKYYIKIVKEINGKNTFIVLVGIKNEMFDDDNNDNIPINRIKQFAENNNILFYCVCLNDCNSVRYLFNDMDSFVS